MLVTVACVSCGACGYAVRACDERCPSCDLVLDKFWPLTGREEGAEGSWVKPAGTGFGEFGVISSNSEGCLRGLGARGILVKPGRLEGGA